MTTGRLYRPPRRWPAMTAVAVAGVLVGGAAGAGIVALATPRTTAAAPAVSTTSEPPPQDTQTSARADRRTCGGWDAAGKLINDAADAMAVIPEGVNILDAAVRDDPVRAAAVQRAGSLFQQASEALSQTITPGSTEVLVQASHTTVSALATLATTYRELDESSGDAMAVARTAAHGMSALCNRLVH